MSPVCSIRLSIDFCCTKVAAFDLCSVGQWISALFYVMTYNKETHMFVTPYRVKCFVGSLMIELAYQSKEPVRKLYLYFASCQP